MINWKFYLKKEYYVLIYLVNYIGIFIDNN